MAKANELQAQINKLEDERSFFIKEVSIQKGINKALTSSLKAANKKLAMARECLALTLSDETPQFERTDYEREMIHGEQIRRGREWMK